MKAISKCLHVYYSRRTPEPSIHYSIQDADGYCKKISPRQWVRLDLPDITSDYTYGEAYRLRSIAEFKSNLQKAIDYRKYKRSTPEYENLNTRQKYQHLLNFLNVNH